MGKTLRNSKLFFNNKRLSRLITRITPLPRKNNFILGHQKQG
jgi:hypothetical protein